MTTMASIQKKQFEIYIIVVALLYLAYQLSSMNDAISGIRSLAYNHGIAKKNNGQQQALYHRQTHNSSIQAGLHYGRESDKLKNIFDTFEEALEQRHKVDSKTGDKMVLLSSVDYAYVEMALNLWETSLKKFGIENFLFICSDLHAHNELARHGLPTFKGKDDSDASKPSLFGTAAFKRKSRLKLHIVFEALKLGYTVLLVDVDIVFLKNPFPFLTCRDCDIQIQNDGSYVSIY